MSWGNNFEPTNQHYFTPVGSFVALILLKLPAAPMDKIDLVRESKESDLEIVVQKQHRVGPE
jgi:hypothetical protein